MSHAAYLQRTPEAGDIQIEAAVGGAAPDKSRRSARFSLSIPVTLRGTDAEGRSFAENTYTITVNQHGGKLATIHRMAQNAEVMIENPAYGHLSRARVVSVAKGLVAEEPFEVGVELSGSSNVWGLKFPLGDSGPRIEPPLSNASPSSQPASVPAPAESTEAEVNRLEQSLDNLKAVSEKAEVSHQGLSELLNKVEGCRQQLAAEVDQAGGRVRESVRPILEMSLQECRSRLEDATESLTTASVVAAHEQWEKTFQKFLDDLALKQLLSISERCKSEAQTQESAFQSKLQLAVTQANESVVIHSDKLKQSMSAETETHLEYAASQMRQETSDALVLFREALDRFRGEALGGLKTEFEGATQASVSLTDQKSEAELRRLVDGIVREQFAAAAIPNRQEAGENLLQLRAELEKIRVEALESSRAAMQQEIHTASGSAVERCTVETSRVVENQVTSAREQIASTAKQAQQEAAETALRLQAELEKIRVEALESSRAAIEQEIHTASGSAVERCTVETSRVVENQVTSVREQIASTAKQAQQEAAETALRLQAELEKVRIEALESSRLAADRAAQSAYDSTIERCGSEVQKRFDHQVQLAVEQLAEGKKLFAATCEDTARQVGANIEADYRRKLERVFAEAMDARIHEFETRLTTAGQDRLMEMKELLDREIESSQMNSMARVQNVSDQATQSALGKIQQGLGSAAMMLKEWTDQATQRLEGAGQKSVMNSEQQIGAFIQAALVELRGAANLHLASVRQHLHDAAAALEGRGPAPGAGQSEAPKSASLQIATPSSSQPPEYSGRVEQTAQELRERFVEEAANQFRAKLDQALRQAV